MTESRYRGVVVDLVDPYLTPEVKNIGGFRSSSPATNTAIWWMRRNPGRWALIAEGSTGLTKQLLIDCHDIEVKVIRSPRLNHDGVHRTYGRVPHPKGETLQQALQRRQVTTPALYLPEVARDEFNWTKDELAEACRVAKANLFPTGADL